MLRSLLHIVALGSTSSMLVACSKERLTCTDLADLNVAAKQLRAALEYKDSSPEADAKSCANCQFYGPAPEGECGTCTLIQGPINPGGYCNSWAPKES